ncbi:MAG: ParB/RepB/Spo0J family partition protein [Chloroflexota bacterium]
MARRRASVNTDSAQTALGTDILDRILETETLPESETSVVDVSLDLIEPNPYQTRRQFDQTALDELAQSIQSQGFYGHLLARPAGNGYQIAYGERRFRASKLAGLTVLPLVIRDFSDEQMMEVAVTENVIREDLNPIEEAEAFQHLSNAGYSIRRMSERVGISVGHISTLLNLIKLPDVAEAVRFDRVGIWAAREIAKVSDLETRRHLLDRTASGELNREALSMAVRLAQEETAFNVNQDIVISSETGSKTVRRIERDTSEDQTPPAMDVLYIYDPKPHLRVALNRLEKIRADRFDDIVDHNKGDVTALLREIASRAQHLLGQLESPWEPPIE